MPGNGWFTTKKSNAEIARDKARAEETRRRQKGLPAKKEKKTKKKPKWEDEDEDVDDDGSIGEFVVNDDEEEGEEEEEADWSEGDEEEEEEDEITESSNRKAKKKSGLGADSSSDDDNGDSDDEDDFLSLPSKPTNRKSRPAPHLMSQRKQEAAGSKKGPGKAKKPATSKTNGRTKRAIDSSDDEKVQKEKEILELSSDDDEDALLADPFAKSKPKKPAAAASKETVSRYFASSSGHESKDFKPEEQSTPVVARRSTYSRARVFDDEDDDDDMPVVAKKTAPVARAFNVDDSDEDDQDMKFAKQRSLVEQSSSSTPIDIVDSEDDVGASEDLALALAIEESEKHAPKSRKKNRFSAFSANRTSILERVGKSDEEENIAEEDPEDEDDNYGGEEELDKDAKEAQAVLETAKRLSGQILQTLTSWGGSSGMIVQDGAIAFTGGDAVAPDQKVSSDWIPKETMKKACPNVELAPYQLMGVNWLSLLHNLTVEVDGKQTNVNGVLADGKFAVKIDFSACVPREC